MRLSRLAVFRVPPRVLPLPTLLALVSMALFAPAPAVAGQGAEGEAIAFVNVNVVTMEDEAVIANAVVLVRDGRIEAVGNRDAVAIPHGAQRIDGGGGYLLPGLIDGHVHMRNVNALRFYLAHGFTTVRDMNANLSKTLAARELVEAGELLGARVVASSPTMLAGPFRDYPAPVTAVDGQALVHKFQEQGYDLIKVFRVRRDAFLGLMEEAQAQGMPVAGHVPSIGLDDPETFDGISFDEVMRSGMTSLEHILEVALAGTGGVEHADRLPHVAAQVAASGIAIGTLAGAALTKNRLKEDREGFLREEGAHIRAMVGERGLEAVEAIDTSPWDVVPETTIHSVIRTFHRAGVRLVVGTDSHSPSSLAGETGLAEIELLWASGLTPFAALRAATRDAADVLGVGTDVGTVEVGKRADLLLVGGNPLVDPTALRDAVGVMTSGRWLDRADLDLLMQAAILEGAW